MTFDLRDISPMVWIVDADWDIPEGVEARRCRLCGDPAAAVLYRPYKGGLPRPWGYCAEHLYGRRIIDGVVHLHVCADSRSARRGFSIIQHGRHHA